MNIVALCVLFGAFFSSSIAIGASERRISSIKYYHSTVGVAAQDAITAIEVDTRLKGWRICHDAASTAGYLAISTNADPATDGLRIAPSQCYQCDDCGSKGLLEANVKADAAATGYSVLQFQ